MRKKPLIVGAVLAVVGLAAAGWFAHKPLLARYYVGQLAQTPEADAEVCIDCVAELGDAAVPRLLDLFHGDAPGWANAGRALAKIVNAWPESDAKAVELAHTLTSGFSQFTPGGRRAALGMVEPLVGRRAACHRGAASGARQAVSDGWCEACGRSAASAQG
jgi:hypothetical protein